MIADQKFRELAHELWLRSESSCQARIAVSDEIPVPVTFGVSQPQILLPRGWERWDEPTLRAVLIHELAHGKRQDAATALLASIATCLFWFHPLSWFLQIHLSALAEEACDEEVLSIAEPEHYAGVLIQFARIVKTHRERMPAVASAVVRHSRLKSRIERLFLASQSRQRGCRLLSGLIFALFLPVLYLTAASRFEQPARTQDATVVASDMHYWQLANTLTAEDEARLTAELQNPSGRSRCAQPVAGLLHATQSARTVGGAFVVVHRASSRFAAP